MTAILVPVLSGILSILASVIITTLKNRSELHKIHAELEQQYTKTLFEKRIEVYPKLFSVLSGFNKLIEYETQSREKLIEVQQLLDGWNNEYAIFITRATSSIAYRYRYYLKDLLSHDQITEKDWADIRQIHVAFEKSLRAEIGLYSTQPAGYSAYERDDMDKIFKETTRKMHDRFK
ncbi:MAG: hypothetical protein GY801_52970 [bacterium]|nr:hypothetical protein [bacterium]